MKYGFLFLFILFLSACATPIAPPGGSRDETPPQVLLQMPQSGMANYKGDKIEILFDEYITFSGGEDKIIITPAMKTNPKYIVKGKKLIIKLPEDLESDITYSISLIDAVGDFTEGNKLSLLRQVFSTGDKIDSASISGAVINAYDLSPKANVFVGLYQPEVERDLKTKPLYISRTNSQGQFRIDYVKEGEYFLAAIEDKNFNYIFDQSTEKISLPSDLISIQGNTILEKELILFENQTKTTVDGYKLLNNKKLCFYFSDEVEDLALDVTEYEEKDKVYFNATNDTLFYHWSSDTLSKLTFNFILDYISRDTVVVPLGKNKLEDKMSTLASIPAKRDIKVKTAKFVESYNTDRISIKDSLNNDLAYQLSSDKEYLSFQLLANFQGPISLMIDSGAVHYFDASVNNKLFVKRIVVEEAKAPNKLILAYNLEGRSNIYLQVLNKEKVLLSSHNLDGTSSLVLNDLKPSSYYLRVYQDLNGNGKWTKGRLEDFVAPEPTLLFSKPIEVKDKWDKEITLSF